MSEFFRALEQAERDRAIRQKTLEAGRDTATVAAPRAAAPLAPPAAAPAVAAPPVVAPPVVTPAPVAPSTVTPPAVTPPAAAPVAPVAPSPFARLPARVQRPEPPAPRPPLVHGVDGHLVSLVRPASVEAEQYRVLRHLVEETRAGKACVLVAVSSPGAGDGKTMTSLNLAGALAQDPVARVLVVDADLRRPSVDKRLGGSGDEPGLIDAILDQQRTLGDVVRRRAEFNMSILPAGHATHTPYELLNSPRLAELLDAARRRYDYIVLDTPPVVPFPDCRVLGKLVDGFFLVVAAHRTPRGLLEEALNVMEPAKVLGIVFNEADRPLSSYYDAAYGYPEPDHTSRRGSSRWTRRKSA
jgi:capsular exopolysaccharide synthesis family protein